MDISLFNYEFPIDLIAQHPLPERDASRLMVLDPEQGNWQHRHFRNITEYFGPDDLIVFNDVKVFPSRLYGQTESRREVEVLLLEEQSEDAWTCLLRPAKKLKSGERLLFGTGDKVLLKGILEGEEDQWRIKFNPVGAPLAAPLREIISTLGLPPLPPYIKRTDPFADKAGDTDRYQCIYAERPGAAAAPTAGFHFTETILKQLQERGAQLAYVTLHVGRDTFQPVRTQKIEDHQMHGEHYEISEETTALINESKQAGKRITAVGTTTVRVLESFTNPGPGHTNKFIYPGYKFQLVDRLLTNFHQPKSTLLMLISALAGRELILDAYRAAIEERYRLFSFGDAMLISSLSKR